MADTPKSPAPVLQKKITIIFPPGDVLTSLVWEKEKDTKIGELLARLCQLRGLNLDDLKALSDVGEKLDTEKTVAQAELVFIELVDKKAQKESKKKSKEAEDPNKVHMQKGIVPGITLTPGKYNTLPMKDQLFPHELQALTDFKTNYNEICQNYSDEFIMSCLFARKLDLVRTHQLLQANWKWRKDNNMLAIPKLSEINPEIMKGFTVMLGTRAKDGTGVSYIVMDNVEVGKEPWTIPTVTKWFAWFYYVGIFSESMDLFRNGITMVENLEGFGWKQFDLEFQKKMSAMWTDTFPMRMKKVYIVNPPIIIEAVMKIMKTFMKAKLADRFEVGSVKELPKLISKEQLSDQFGGKFKMTHEEAKQQLKEWTALNEERLIAPGRPKQ